MNPMIGFAVKAARRAGDIINRAADNIDRLKIRHKAQNDLVSEVDRTAEKAIVESLQKVYPDHAFLCEESGKIGESDFEWIIDPLDGTTNFLHQLPIYAVSIALSYKKQLQVGVIYDPSRNDLFTASRGEGAYLNEKRIRVSKRDKLIDSLIGTGFPFRENDDIDQYTKIFKSFALNTSGIRRPGAASLDLASVAAGRLDGFWESGLSPWDMAAGVLMITEAGGLVGDYTGENSYMETGEILAGNPKIFVQMLKTLRPHLDQPMSIKD